MIAIVEKVKDCTLYSEQKLYSHIDNGLLVLLGVQKEDTLDKVEHFAHRILKLRIFRDENDKMNKNINDVNGQIMLVSNFTLCGRTKGTNRPDFTNSKNPKEAKEIYLKMFEVLKKFCPTETGVFQTHMDIQMTANGPGTFILEE